MLVLSRKANESIAIGATDACRPVMKVTVLEIKQGAVRLGFEIASEVPVHRWEIWERIRLSNFSSGALEPRVPAVIS